MILQLLCWLFALELASFSYSQYVIADAVAPFTIQSPHYCISVMMPNNSPRYICPQQSDSDPWDYPSLNEDAPLNLPKKSWIDYLQHPASPDQNNYFHPAKEQDRTVEIHWGFDREYSGTERLVAKWVDKIKIPEKGAQTFYVDRFFCLYQLLVLPGPESTPNIKKIACASHCSDGKAEPNPYHVNNYIDNFIDRDTPIGSGPFNDQNCDNKKADEIDTETSIANAGGINTDHSTGSNSDDPLRLTDSNTFNSGDFLTDSDSEDLNFLVNAQAKTPVLNTANFFTTGTGIQPDLEAFSNENYDNSGAVGPLVGSADTDSVLNADTNLGRQMLPQLDSPMNTKRDKNRRWWASKMESGTIESME